ncbi:MAG TPA: hypothetical protein VMC07_01615 [Candidatus Omnitrophota bacterium]|nr:hypothetical protein [Candidatus Omnitrophota bacterium]
MIQFLDFNLPFLIVSFIFFLIGAYFLIKTIVDIDERFKSGIIFIFFAFILHFAAAFLNLQFLAMDLDYNSWMWLIDPFLNLIEAGCLLFGAQRFYLALEGKMHK